MFKVRSLGWLWTGMGPMYLLVEHLRQCQRTLCLHLVSEHLLSSFYRASLWLRLFLERHHRLEVFVPSSLCVWSQMPWRNLQIIRVLPRGFLMKENDFILEEARRRRYPARTIINVDFADDIALLANSPAQARSLLHSLKRAAGGIGLHINADKTEYICFNQRGDISTLNGGSLKLASSVSTTENNINTWLTKAWQLPIHYRSYGSQT